MKTIPKPFTVHFLGVGRDKKTWTAQASSLSDSALVRLIHAESALGSRNVEFNWNEEGTAADIFVGGFRKVGSLTTEGGIRV